MIIIRIVDILNRIWRNARWPNSSARRRRRSSLCATARRRSTTASSACTSSGRPRGAAAWSRRRRSTWRWVQDVDHDRAHVELGGLGDAHACGRAHQAFSRLLPQFIGFRNGVGYLPFAISDARTCAHVRKNLLSFFSETEGCANDCTMSTINYKFVRLSQNCTRS